MKSAIIIGAGPAGLTAALELLRRTDIKPIVLEADDCVGGISRTVKYRGNRIDIGGHRFFSKSDWVTNWWKEILPVLADAENNDICYHHRTREIDASAVVAPDQNRVMLNRRRLSRIYYLRKFFDYPIRLSRSTLRNLGLIKLFNIATSYAWARIFLRLPEKTLEDFFINRFGLELYRTFFKGYTEKVWGVPCHEIAAEWGAQRIKALSVAMAIKHAIQTFFNCRFVVSGQKNINTSLIEHFFYPTFGPGQMWEEVARRVVEMGGEIRFRHQVRGLRMGQRQVIAVRAWDQMTQCDVELSGDYVFSTMPVRDLLLGMGDMVPVAVREIAVTLPYRDFITVGLLAKKMRPNSQSRSRYTNNMPPDNWIYIQESDVKVGRLQIFNNWSPGMIGDPNKIWMGLEYFCNEGDSIWSLSDPELINLAQSEMAKIGLLDEADVEDGVVIRMPKAYPAYFGSYQQFSLIRQYLDNIQNLFPIGRNGMHRYNNQDHSMLTAKLAVDNIISGINDKTSLWDVNVDDDYLEGE